MVEALTVVGGAIVGSVIGPGVLAMVQGRQRRREAEADAEQRSRDKQEDWHRQDQVAARLEARQDQQALALAAADHRAQEAAAYAAGQLGEIHTLVNSNLTEALRGQLAATVGHVAALRRVLGDPPDPADVEAIATLDAAVAQMTTDLHDRDAAAERVDERS